MANENGSSELSDQKELEALRFANRAMRSVSVLELHRKSVVREYAGRVKQLKKIIQSIQQREQMGQLALDGLDRITFGDEDLQLVNDPLRGL